MGIPPTGQEVEWRDMHVTRFDGEMIAEEWVVSGLAGQLLLGIRLHVRPPWAFVLAATDPSGAAQVTVPLPGGTAGARFFSQFIWANTGACVAPGTLSASDALEVTIQPRS